MTWCRRLMKSCTASLLLAAATVLPAQDTNVTERDFTNTAGKTIRASVVRIEGTNVRLKVGGKSYPVPISSLVEADKAFLKGWLAEHPWTAFKLEAFQRKGPSPLGGTMVKVEKPIGSQGPPILNAKEVPGEIFHYELRVTYDSGIELKNVEVRYRVLVKVTSKSKVSRKVEQSGVRYDQFAGVTRIPSMRPGVDNGAKTGTVTLTELHGSSISIDRDKLPDIVQDIGDVRRAIEGTRTSELPEPAGVWFRLFHNGQMIREFLHWNDGVRRTVDWDEEAPMIQGVANP